MATDARTDVLLVTATEVETRSALALFGSNETERPRNIGGRVYFDLGEVNGARVRLTQCEMGSSGLDSSQQAITKALVSLSPNYVVMMGIAFGVNTAKQSIGDILISKQLRPYELQRVGTSDGDGPSIILRDDKPHASPELVNLFRSSTLTWRGAPTQVGTILTGSKLVDNVDYRAELLRFEPEAIGGEMEAGGLYVACHDAGVQWIVVKALCDFADGQKSYEKAVRQAKAAENAAAFVLHALSFAETDWSRRSHFSATPSSRPRRPGSDARGRQEASADSAARARYLTTVRAKIARQIKATVHNALALELKVENAPAATHLPWTYKDATTGEAFETIDGALAEYNNRVLILGGPGSGKTTTLLQVAERIGAKAAIDPLAPLPVLINLSSFHMKSGDSLFRLRRKQVPPTEVDTQLLDWIVADISRQPGVSRHIARHWIETGKIALLLDGLDEVDSDKRSMLISLLNATYLRQRPDDAILIASRVSEYLPHQERKDTRLQLEGAVTLQSLSTQQTLEYLRAAGAHGLMGALQAPGSVSLQDLASTPLTLSMLTLAYGRSRAPANADGTPLSLDKHSLMEFFAAQMLQRKERRDRIVQFDTIEDNAVAVGNYRYSPKKIDAALSWFAVRMSVRMEASVPLAQLFRFLSTSETQDPHWSSRWLSALGFGGLVFLLLLLTALVGGGSTDSGMLVGVTVATLGSLGCIVLLRLVEALDDDSFGLNFAEGASLSVFLRGSAGIIGLSLLAAIGLASVSISASSLLDGQASPLYAGLLAESIAGIALFVTVGIADGGRWDYAASFVMVAILCGVVLATCGSPWDGLRAPDSWTSLSLWLAGLEFATFLIFVSADGWVAIALSVVGAACVVGLQALGLWLVSPVGEILPVLGVAAGIAACSVGRNACLVTGLAVVFVTASTTLGCDAAVISVCAAALLTLAIYVLFPFAYLERAVERTEEVLDRVALSPIIIGWATFLRVLPFRVTDVLRYSNEALLLKSAHPTIEFTHRVLRDYFALLELSSRARSGDLAERASAIRALGFQGDAAIDTLGEILRTGQGSERAAAVDGLARIASSSAVPYLLEAARDSDPRIRRAVVLLSARRWVREERDILACVVNDDDPLVEKALIDTVVTRYGVHGRLLGYELVEGEWLLVVLMSLIAARPTVREHFLDIVCYHTHAWSRAFALRLVVGSRVPQAVNCALGALADEAPQVRREAAAALSRLSVEHLSHDEIGKHRVEDSLAAAARDPDRGVRAAARQGLSRIGSQEALRHLSIIDAEMVGWIRRLLGKLS